MKYFERGDVVRFTGPIGQKLDGTVVRVTHTGRIRNLDQAIQCFEVHCMDGRYRMVDVREVTLVAPPTAKR